MQNYTAEIEVAMMFKDDYERIREAKIDTLLFNDNRSEYYDAIGDVLSSQAMLENGVLHRIISGYDLDDDKDGLRATIIAVPGSELGVWGIDYKEALQILQDAVGEPISSMMTHDERTEEYLLSNFNVHDFKQNKDNCLNGFRLHRVTETSYVFTVSRDIELKYIVNQLRIAFFTRLSEICSFDTMMNISPSSLIKHLMHDQEKAA